ncbi:glycosyltransferase family 32 protein [Aspergillus homomorphus CBS 101889]|uniref:Mannosyl phosphorylinositol ceramide synthase SUR1 n=1 Tax=Aspergillus homomorphus (strain CBS 101889) TaxID=1450537 RepID=A0A395IHE7_ASPHC|nr:mannosyl phosphorylinositol ceramide synthase SUR1 [Aspergillus homomorphus CBS 101889]RAL17634.1 mannosyl phosphorylinositol ceramide synthase SUR1 [Aspergillus homomorphus CBS 101889]
MMLPSKILKQQAMKCRSILPTLFLSPQLEALIIRARQGPFLTCVTLYLLITFLSWLASFLHFRTSLHDNLITHEHLAPETTPVAHIEQPIQWAPPSISDGTENTNNNSAVATAPIPQIIHRMWRHLTSDIPSEWSNATTSCQAQNPVYQQYIWTDKTAHQFIARHFPWYLATYTDHLLPMQRVDALRYLLLWHYGGVFLDPELGCGRSLGPLLSAGNVQQGHVLLPQRWPYGVGTEMMASPPGHPFIIKLALTAHAHRWSGIPAYVMAFAESGSVVVSRALAVWLRSVAGGGGSAQTTIAIVPSALFDDAESGEAFFVRCAGQTPRGDEVAVAEHVFGNWLGWCGAGLSLAGMALVIFGLTSQPKRSVTQLLV